MSSGQDRADSRRSARPPAQNADEAGRGGVRAYQQIRAAYSWDSLAEEFIDIYQHVT